jgi:hypothetical protein
MMNAILWALILISKKRNDDLVAGKNNSLK